VNSSFCAQIAAQVCAKLGPQVPSISADEPIIPVEALPLKIETTCPSTLAEPVQDSERQTECLAGSCLSSFIVSSSVGASSRDGSVRQSEAKAEGVTERFRGPLLQSRKRQARGLAVYQTGGAIGSPLNRRPVT
jgi:hypothetical protein